MKMKKLVSILLVGAMTTALLAGCGSKENAQPQEVKGTSVEKSSEGELPDVELWNTIVGTTKGIEKDGPMYNFYKDVLGVGIVEPYVEWNGGSTYQAEAVPRQDGWITYLRCMELPCMKDILIGIFMTASLLTLR